MDWKIILIALLAIGHAYRLILNVVQFRSANNPTPQNVADVYDAETYTKWKSYNAEKSRLEIASTILSFAVMLVLLLTGAYPAAASLLSANIYTQMLAVLVFDAVVSTVINIGFKYVETMVIEQKYGFNRTTVKTFVLDQIRDFVLEIALSFFLGFALALLHGWLGNWVILLFAAVVFGFSLIISFLYPIFSRIGNKFTPLPDGELKDRLMGLLTKHGYHVKAIEVMDASRRTTKLNAYFTGFGKMKTIVLYDNLVNNMSTDEICAVFSHELGHGLHRDVLKQQIMNIGNMLLMSVIIWAAVSTPELHTAFGFESVNYGFAYIALGIALAIVQPFVSMLTSAYSRHAEYRADRQAVKEGYGEALVSSLKTLAKENFSNLSPSRALVVLEYSHPPLSERIAAIEKEIEKNI